MELIYNAMMNSMQTSADRTSTASKGSEKDDFQKLMDQKQTGTAASQQETSETPAKTEETAPVQDSAVVVTEDPKELEKRMSLAAMMALAQNPIVADIAEETPQVLTDPSWEEGLVPVGYDDQGDLRIVHWMQADAASQNLEDKNAVAGEWVEAQDAVETEVEAPVMEAEADVEAPEISTTLIEENTAGTEQEDLGAELPEEAPAETPVFGEVEAAPVKVGEAPVHGSAEAENVGDQVGPWMAKLSENMTEGDTRTLVVHLEPESMGKIHLEMTLNKDGSLHVALHAENSQTQSLLSRNTEGLAEILGKYTQNNVQVEVPRQEEGQRQDLLNQQQQQQQQQQQEQRKSRQESGEDFLQQMRLGLVSIDEE